MTINTDKWIHCVTPSGTKFIVPCDVSKTSDGYHTFDELYEHRHLLLAMACRLQSHSWRSRKHSDGEAWEGWFIAGIQLPTGMITYHLPDRMWDLMKGVKELEFAPEWDGHTPDDVLQRIRDYLIEGR